MIGVIDYKSCNIASVQNALDFLGLENCKISKVDEFQGIRKIILPGVGSISSAKQNLVSSGMYEKLVDFSKIQENFLLGICLGMQLLYEYSEEDDGVDCMGIIKGKVKKIISSSRYKVPNIGWRKCSLDQSSSLFKNVTQGSAFYFVHSYHCSTEDKTNVVGTIDYAGKLDISVSKENVFGVQFHPEKSQTCGLQVLRNFSLL